MDQRAPDGSPIEFYRQLPDLGEVALLGPHLPEGAAILGLGCGAGRMTAGLLELGHPVTAVDESEAMIAAAQERAPGARYLVAPIVLTQAQVTNDRLEATVRYEVGERSWEQALVADLLDEPALHGCLEQAGLAFERWTAPEQGWFTARGALGTTR